MAEEGNFNAPEKSTQRKKKKNKTFVRVGLPIILVSITAIGGIIVALIQAGDINFHCCLPPPTTIVGTPTPMPTAIPSPPVLVQSNFVASSDSTSPTVGSTTTVPLSQPVRKGDLILVAITQYERQVSKLSDTQGDAYTKVGGTLANSSDQQDYVELYYFQDVIGGPSTTVTVTFGGFSDDGGGDTNVGVYEYAGLSVTSPKDDSDINTSRGQLSKTPRAGRQLTVSGNNEVCFAVGIDSGVQDDSTVDNPTLSQGQGYKLLYPTTANQMKADDAGSAERFYTEAGLVPQGGCVPNFSIAYPSLWAIISISLKP